MAISSATVETAISEVLTDGQSVMIDGVQYTRGNLSALYRMLQDARAREALNNGTRRRRKTANLSLTGYE